MTIDGEKVFGKHYESKGKPPPSRMHDGERLTDGIAATKRQYDGLKRESDGEEINRTWISLLEVDDFCTRSVREAGGVLEIYRQGAEGDEKAQGPVQQGHTNGASVLEDSSSCGERSAKEQGVDQVQRKVYVLSRLPSQSWC